MVARWVRGGALVLLGALVFASASLWAAPQPDDGAGASSLAGRLLVATPELEDPNFDHTVVYMIHHDASGAMGLVINRVVAAGSLAELLHGLGIETDAETDPGVDIRIHEGGPVERERGFVLHSGEYQVEGTITVTDTVAMTSSLDVLRDIAAGKGPERSLFALGYAGWAANQLEGEIAAGAWYTVEADDALLFDEQAETKWQRALDRHGIEL
jgi:putative transcriptional regulator